MGLKFRWRTSVHQKELVVDGVSITFDNKHQLLLEAKWRVNTNMQKVENQLESLKKQAGFSSAV